MKKILIITTLLVMTSLVVLAQNEPKTNAKADSMIKKAPIEVGNHMVYGYTINGKVQTSDAVKAKLYAYAPSRVELLISSKNMSWLGVSVIGFAVSGVGATLEFINNNRLANSSGDVATVSNHHNLSGAYVLSGAATAFVFSAIFHSMKAKRHVNKALVLYNQQYQ